MATNKQKRFAEIVKKNLCKPGKKPVLKDMAKAAGYSDSVASQPGANITNTRGLKEMVAEILPNQEVVNIHAGLMKEKILSNYTFDISLKDSVIKRIAKELNYQLLQISSVPALKKKIVYWIAPNARIRQQGLELYHKVMGNYSHPKVKQAYNDIDDMTEEELDEKLKETEALAARAKKFNK